LAVGYGHAGILHDLDEDWPIQFGSPEYEKLTPKWIVLEALSKAWNLNKKWVVEKHEEIFEKDLESLVVGDANGSPVSGYAFSITKPTA
jgi:hypothetical protein